MTATITALPRVFLSHLELKPKERNRRKFCYLISLQMATEDIFTALCKTLEKHENSHLLDMISTVPLISPYT